MNNIIYKLLPVTDKFIPDIHLRHSEFGYSAYGPFTKNKTRMQQFKGTRHSGYLPERDKSYFQHDLASRSQRFQIFIKKNPVW